MLRALALFLLLSACAGGAMDARPPLTGAALSAPAPAPPAPPGPAGDNQRATAPPEVLTLAAHGAAESIPVAHWPATGNTRAVIVSLHGYGDYGASTFGIAATGWAARGIAVYAPDQRGFGRAPGRMRWPGADTLIDDAGAVYAAVAARHPGAPVTVAGHSMGGGVALAAAGEGRFPGAAGLVLLAPAVWGGEALNPFLRASAWAAALVMPDLRWTGRGVVRVVPSDNTEMLIALSRDPLHYAAPSGREFMGLVRLMDRAVAAAPDAPGPTLVVLGAHEDVVNPASVRALRPHLRGGAEFAYPPDGWHMLLRDRHADAVRDLVADWVLARATPGSISGPTPVPAPTPAKEAPSP
ncbi:MAG: alpha-beta hydrolase superfamily lysophospholipase [Paracoccaceae bacterium]|jgi:acylglycerol lipase